MWGWRREIEERKISSVVPLELPDLYNVLAEGRALIVDARAAPRDAIKDAFAVRAWLPPAFCSC